MENIIYKTVDLDPDEFNDDVYTIIAAFRKQAHKEGWTPMEIYIVLVEADRLNDFSHFLATIEAYCSPKTKPHNNNKL